VRVVLSAIVGVALAAGAAGIFAQVQHGAGDDPDRLYRQREDISLAARAADLWAARAATDFE